LDDFTNLTENFQLEKETEDNEARIIGKIYNRIDWALYFKEKFFKKM